MHSFRTLEPHFRASLDLKYPEPSSNVPGRADVDVIIFLSALCHLQHTTIATNDGEKLFYVDGKGAYQSWSIRRPLKDALGHPVFELRHYGADPKMQWCVEDSNGNKIAELSHKKFFTSSHTAIDAKIFSSGAIVEM